jgi:carboxypeptidase C (cathepsin A)
LQSNDLQKTLKEVEAWAVSTYMPALAKGDTLPAEERSAVAGKLSRYTGLPVETVEKADLRVDGSLFRKTLLSDNRQIVGRFDSRLIGYDPKVLNRNPDFDPSFDGFFAAYSGTFNDYARRVLKYETDTPYEVLTGRVRPWNFGQQEGFGAGWLNVTDNLQNAMRKNPHMKVLFASGIYDLATPYFGTDYTVARLDLNPELRRNISQTYYPGGHMMYHHRPTLRKLHDDVKSFVEGALAPQKEEEPAVGRTAD